MKETDRIRPDPGDQRLTVTHAGRDQAGGAVELATIVERPLELRLNGHDVVTLMTIGAQPDLLAVGYLFNHNLLRRGDAIEEIALDEAGGRIEVRIERAIDWSAGPRDPDGALGGAAGTAFGALIADLERAELEGSAVVRAPWVFQLQNAINATPSLYQKAGALHACVLCEEDEPLVYVEELGRHGAMDMIAGHMVLNGIDGADKMLYTTGRLTHGMVIKAVKMGVPVLLTRSGFSSWGVELARKAGLTMIGRIRGQRFVVISGEERVRD